MDRSFIGVLLLPDGSHCQHFTPLARWLAVMPITFTLYFDRENPERCANAAGNLRQSFSPFPALKAATSPKPAVIADEASASVVR